MKYIIFLLLLISFAADAQVKQQLGTYGVRARRLQSDSAFRVPTVQVGIKDAYAGLDTAQLYYNKTDSTLEVYTGVQWIDVVRASGGGGGTEMPYFFLEDYFAANGGAADDFTDCSAAIQAMFDDVDAFGGGVMVFPEGTCVQLTDVTLALAGAASHVMVIGAAGGSAVRFGRSGTDLGSYFNAWGITSPESFSIENMAFIGSARSGSPYDLLNRGLYLNVDKRVSVKNCQFYGIAGAGSEENSGILVIQSGSAIVENCAFNGSAGVNTSVALNFNGCGVAVARNCEFLDYQASWRGAEDFIKSPLGNYAWIQYINGLSLNGNSPRSVLIEGCRFDEAAASAVRIRDAENAEVRFCSENIGSGDGSYYYRIRNLKLTNNWAGYASTGTPRKAMVIDSVDNVTVENVKFTVDIKWIHLLADVKMVNLKDNKLQGSPDYPRGIRNDAGALVRFYQDSAKVVFWNDTTYSSHLTEVNRGLGLQGIGSDDGVTFGVTSADPVPVYQDIAGELQMDGIIKMQYAKMNSGFQSANTTVDMGGTDINALMSMSDVSGYILIKPDPNGVAPYGLKIVPDQEIGFNEPMISVRNTADNKNHFTVMQNGVLYNNDIVSTPTTPGAGTGGWYTKGDKPFFISDAGTEYDLTSDGDERFGVSGEDATAAQNRSFTHSGFEFQTYAQMGTKKQLIRSKPDSTMGVYMRDLVDADLAYMSINGIDSSANLAAGVPGSLSGISIKPSGINVAPQSSRLFINPLSYTLTTTGKKLMLRDTATGLVENIDPALFAGGTPAGNFGNLQINRNGAFATPASDSLDWESATGLTVKGDITTTTGNIIGDGSTTNISLTTAGGSKLNYGNQQVLVGGSEVRLIYSSTGGLEWSAGADGVGALFPTDDNERNLGSTTRGWRYLYNTRGAIFNSSGVSTGDVQIKGDTDDNLLFTDASTDRVGIKTASPSVEFEVNGTAKFGTTNAIVGTATNNSATAGNIGEEITSTVSTYTNYTTTATYQAITSITLTAGDWDLSAFFTYSANSATITAGSNAIFVVSTTTASAAGSTEGLNIAYVPQAALLGTSFFSDAITPFRVSLSGSTTYYLNTQATFTLGNPQYVGTIRARRMR